MLTSAEIRLQEEIMKISNDESLFAWEQRKEFRFSQLLAASPAVFVGSANYYPVKSSERRPPYMMTNKGLQISLLLSLPIESVVGDVFTAVLNCKDLQTNELVGFQMTIDEDHKGIYDKNIRRDYDFFRVRPYRGRSRLVKIRNCSEYLMRTMYISATSPSTYLAENTKCVWFREGPSPATGYTVCKTWGRPPQSPINELENESWIPPWHHRTFTMSSGHYKDLTAAVLVERWNKESFLILFWGEHRLGCELRRWKWEAKSMSFEDLRNTLPFRFADITVPEGGEITVKCSLSDVELEIRVKRRTKKMPEATYWMVDMHFEEKKNMVRR